MNVLHVGSEYRKSACSCMVVSCKSTHGSSVHM